MRRLPVYFLVDVSESMVGAPIEHVQQGMRTIIQSLRNDPYALETVYVSIIAFAGKAKVLSPLTELYKFYPPTFPIGGGTSLGSAFECLMSSIDKEIKKTTMEEKGDWKPIIFLFTDGNPTDQYAEIFRKWNDRYRNHCNLVAISIGDAVNVLTLAQLTDNILLLKDTDAESFSKFFKWVSASVSTSSMSVSEQYEDGIRLAPTTGINLEKVENPREYIATVDENYVVLHARCQTTKNDYLIKYGHRPDVSEYAESEPGVEFRLIGAYQIDKESYASMSAGKGHEINTMRMRGVPTCPCCGNQHGAVVCECGGIFCVEGNGRNVCPWCGAVGTIGDGGGDTGINITRGLG